MISPELQVYAQAIHALREITPEQRRNWREGVGYSVSALAKMLNVTPGVVRGYERGVMPSGYAVRLYYEFLVQVQPPAVPEPEEPALTPEYRAVVRAYFAAGEICAHCRGVHTRACPRVKRMAYHPEGPLAEVEFWPDGKWPTDNVIFADSPELTEDDA